MFEVTNGVDREKSIIWMGDEQFSQAAMDEMHAMIQQAVGKQADVYYDIGGFHVCKVDCDLAGKELAKVGIQATWDQGEDWLICEVNNAC